jgi:hypothetical protein
MFGISKNLLTLIKGSAIILCLPLYAWCPPALAQQGLKIELNKLESVEGACRAYMLFENKSGTAFDSLKLDLVMFDPNGVINKRLAVEGAPLPVGKTSVKLFDIQGLACAEVDRILLNDVLSCRGPGGEISDCLIEIDTTSRNSVLFFK